MLNSPHLPSTNLPAGIDFPHLRENERIRERPEPPSNYTSDAGQRDRQREGGRITWNVHLLEEDHSSPVCVRVCLCIAVYPGAVSLQHSLIHSISLFVGARVCGRRRQEREGWRVITGTSCCSLIGHLLCHGAGPQPSYITDNLTEGLGIQFNLFQARLHPNWKWEILTKSSTSSLTEYFNIDNVTVI